MARHLCGRKEGGTEVARGIPSLWPGTCVGGREGHPITVMGCLLATSACRHCLKSLHPSYLNQGRENGPFFLQFLIPEPRRLEADTSSACVGRCQAFRCCVLPSSRINFCPARCDAHQQHGFGHHGGDGAELASNQGRVRARAAPQKEWGSR